MSVMYRIEGEALSLSQPDCVSHCVCLCVSVCVQVVNHLDSALLQLQFKLSERSKDFTLEKYTVIFTTNTGSCRFIDLHAVLLRRAELAKHNQQFGVYCFKE